MLAALKSQRMPGTKEQLLRAPELRGVLQYHIAPQQSLTYAGLAQLPYLTRLPTLYGGQPLFVVNKFGTVKLAATSRQIGGIVRPDVLACGGRAIAQLTDVVSRPPFMLWKPALPHAQARASSDPCR